MKVVLAELLRRGHIECTRANVGNGAHRIVEDLPSGVGGEQLVPLRQLQVADERVLKFADYCVRLVVLYRRAEAHQRAFSPDLQNQLESHAAQSVVGEPQCIFLACDHRLAVGAAYFNLLTLRSIIIESPEGRSSGIVAPVEA